MIYDEFGLRLGDEYEMLLKALSGQYMSIVAPGIEITPHAIKSFIIDSRRLGNTFFQIAESEADKYLENLYGDSAELPQTALDAKYEFLNLLRRTVMENAIQLSKMLRVGSSDYKRVIKDASGSLGLLLQKKMSVIEFKTHDSAGRKWDARRMVAVSARDFAYQTWLTMRVEQLLGEGFKLGYIERDVPKDQDRGFAFSLGEKIGAYPAFDEIRGKIFHVNSTARVAGYVPA